MATYRLLGGNSAFRLALSLTLFMVFGGCRGFATMVRFQKSSDPYKGSDYKVALTNWNREARIYRGFDLELIAAATFKSSRFINAYAAEYARAYKLTEAEKNQLIKDQKEAADSYNDFILAAYVPNKKWNDFSEKNSIWKIYLTSDGRKLVKPAEIRKIKKIDAVTSHFFPYITPWKSIYLVRFPVKFPGTSKTVIDDSTTCIKLMITSVVGSAEMEWVIRD